MAFTAPNQLSDFKLTQQAAIRWREYKLLTGDPGYPDYPIPIPPNETHRKVGE